MGEGLSTLQSSTDLLTVLRKSKKITFFCYCLSALRVCPLPTFSRSLSSSCVAGSRRELEPFNASRKHGSSNLFFFNFITYLFGTKNVPFTNIEIHAETLHKINKDENCKKEDGWLSLLARLLAAAALWFRIQISLKNTERAT
jgi:hypothetical protein